MPEKFIRRIVRLEWRDIAYIQRIMAEKGLGEKGFSAAVRLIIREHQAIYGSSSAETPPTATVVVPPSRDQSED